MKISALVPQHSLQRGLALEGRFVKRFMLKRQYSALPHSASANRPIKLCLNSLLKCRTTKEKVSSELNDVGA